MELPVCHSITVSNQNDLAFSPTFYLAQNAGCPTGSFRRYHPNSTVVYDAFCDDFGPMNLTSTTQFIHYLEFEIQQCIEDGVDQLVYEAGKGPRAFTNAAFLLGAYLLLKKNHHPTDVSIAFQGAFDQSPQLFEGFRDATFSAPDFRLSLLDCWHGLYRGIRIGWVGSPTLDSPSDWGKIDIEMYAHYDNPLNADLHEVVPGKFVAFRGPRHLDGPTFINDYVKRTRVFDPKHYLNIFHDLNVKTVIRLNEVSYPAKDFTDNGIEHHDLFFEDCTSPPPAVVKRFLRIVDGAKGVVAIHCKAGLGRTGTLIALDMMRCHGFSAREAMGWLRIMRPGSVIGCQQRFLADVDAAMRPRNAADLLPRDHLSSETGLRSMFVSYNPVGSRDLGTVTTLAAEQAHQISEGIARRDQARSRSGRARRYPASSSEGLSRTVSL